MFVTNIPSASKQTWAVGLISLALACGLHTQAPKAPQTAPPPPRPVSVHSTVVQDQESFAGIGAYVGADAGHDDRLTVVEPLPGLPAEKAGLVAGDVIEEVDGRATTDLRTDEAVQLIRGEEGTDVRLAIYRPSSDERFQLLVTRARVIVPRKYRR